MPKEITVNLTDLGLESLIRVARDQARKSMVRRLQCERERRAIEAHMELNDNDSTGAAMLNSNDLAQDKVLAELANWMALYRSLTNDPAADFLYRMLNEYGVSGGP